MSFLFCLVMGALYDFVGIFYARSFMDRRAGAAAVVSMWMGAASLLGLQTAFHDWWGAAGLILGYGVGAYAGTRWIK